MELNLSQGEVVTILQYPCIQVGGQAHVGYNKGLRTTDCTFFPCGVYIDILINFYLVNETSVTHSLMNC